MDKLSDFCSLRSFGKYRTTNKSNPMSYTRVRETLQFLNDIDQTETFFLCIVGTLAALNNNVPDRLLKVHGRWVAENRVVSIIMVKFSFFHHL